LSYWMFALTLCIALLAVTPTSARQDARGFLAKTVTVGDKDFKYVVYVPTSCDPKKPMPAIIFLNGMGECGSDGWRQVYHFGSAIMLNAEKWPFIIMFPQKQSAPSQWEDEDAMVMAVLEKTRKEYRLDKSRLYLTGLSQGGHGTWAIGARHADLFAAIAPICGYGDKSLAEKLGKMPVWSFHGDADTTVPPERSVEMDQWLKDAGGSPKLTIYPGVGHNSWDKAYRDEDLGAWFLEHKKGE